MNERPTLRVVIQLPAANDSEKDAATAFLVQVGTKAVGYRTEKDALKNGTLQP